MKITMELNGNQITVDKDCNNQEMLSVIVCGIYAIFNKIAKDENSFEAGKNKFVDAIKEMKYDSFYEHLNKGTEQ